MESTEDYIVGLVGRKNIFKVPEGYFDKLQQVTLQRANTHDEEQQSSLSYLGLTSEIESVTESLNDINAPVDASNEEPAFNPDYFSGLHRRILSRIQAENPAQSEAAGTGLSDSQTAGVFQLTGQADGETDVKSDGELYGELYGESGRLIAGLEARGLPRIISSGVFAVPSDYFSKLPGRILSGIRPEKGIVSLWAKPLVRYAAAASVALVLGLSLGFSALQIKLNVDNKSAYARLAPEDRFLSKYDIDESVVEDELVSPGNRRAADAGSVHTPEARIQDIYILDHADEHSLVAEI